MAEVKLETKAPAKVNLDLLVTARRPDGYHELDSLVVFAGAHDKLVVAAREDLSLEVDGPFASQVPTDRGNLVLRAACLLAETAGDAPRASICLTKALPVAAGLGGGSADAAATLQVLCRLWNLQPAPEDLRRIGLSLGADLPVCLSGRPTRMRGVGERLDPVRGLPELPLLLVNPGRPLATSAVFKSLRVRGQAPRPPFPTLPSVVQLAVWLAESRNDLEPAAISLLPEIGNILQELRALPGCLLARMSGSGPTCWALFRDEGELRVAEGQLARSRPAWWRWAGVTRDGSGSSSPVASAVI